jgi:chromosome partitioning protein
LLLGGLTFQDCLQRVEEPAPGFDLLPSNADLTAAEVGLMRSSQRERRLAEVLASAAEDYDLVIIDCPPSLNMLTVNALVAAQGVLIPIQCEYYALEGLSALLDTIEQVRVAVNPELEIEGLLRTMYDARNNLANDVSAQLQEHFGDRVYRTIVPRNVRLAEAPSHGLPVLRYDKASRGAAAYLALAGEYLRRHPVTETTPVEAPEIQQRTQM